MMFLQDEDEDDDIGTTAGDAERRGSHAEAGPRSYEARRADGTPQPLTPELLTLSLLPRTQWHNLAHLDAIKASYGKQRFPQGLLNVDHCALMIVCSYHGACHLLMQVPYVCKAPVGGVGQVEVS